MVLSCCLSCCFYSVLPLVHSGFEHDGSDSVEGSFHWDHIFDERGWGEDGGEVQRSSHNWETGSSLVTYGAGLVFIVFQPQVTLARFHPFFVGDPANFGQALVLIFWAYAGFELSTLPADEIQDARRTIPRAIAAGMFIVIVFYLTTNFVIIANVDQQALASSPAPLTVAAANIFGVLPGLAILGSAHNCRRRIDFDYGCR